MDLRILVLTVLTTCGLSVVCKPALIEGDMVMEPKLLKIMENGKVPELPTNNRRVRRSVSKQLPHEHRWKNGFVPYRLSVELSDKAREVIKEAFRHIEKYTCIQFSPWIGEDDYVDIISDTGCYSSIGRQNGRQTLSIGEGCETMKTVIHELLHTLGMFHEQTRMDRGLYVRVLWWNIQRGAERNFGVYDHGVIDSMNFPYDFKSAMHYHNSDFTKNGDDTIQAIDSPKELLGNDYGMSKTDIKKVYQFYKCYKKKTRPVKAECKDKYSWCGRFKKHCTISWLSDRYCQKTCNICVS